MRERSVEARGHLRNGVESTLFKVEVSQGWGKSDGPCQPCRTLSSGAPISGHLVVGRALKLYFAVLPGRLDHGVGHGDGEHLTGTAVYLWSRQCLDLRLRQDPGEKSSFAAIVPPLARRAYSLESILYRPSSASRLDPSKILTDKTHAC